MVMRKSDRPRGSPLVVKLGGSLRGNVAELAPVLQESPRPLLIVPGGGIFADAVRRARAEEDPSHWMAVVAMDQFGWTLISQGIGATTLLQIPDRTLVFLPYCSMQKNDPLPHSWDVTSDSIAAWVASVLRLDLLVLKSVDGITDNGHLMNRVNSPISSDVVDPFFIPFVLEKGFTATVINGSSPDRVEKFLKGDSIPGTRIGTTF
jgi:aspartokinase-like uncharacterized kinase